MIKVWDPVVFRKLSASDKKSSQPAKGIVVQVSVEKAIEKSLKKEREEIIRLKNLAENPDESEEEKEQYGE